MRTRPSKRPTLEDVAARAGVSRALVSIVMRGVPGASATTRERVVAAAAEIGYRPDTRARLLASGEARQLGVMFETAGRFHTELLDGLYAAAGSPDRDYYEQAAERLGGTRACLAVARKLLKRS